MGRTVTQEVLTGPFLGTSLDDTFSATTGGIVNAVFQTSGGFEAPGGNDTISGVNNNSDGVGIANTLIVFGEGDDVLTARGTSRGVENVFIVGEAGNDTYDIQNGLGIIYDEAGNDLLILEGQKSDYSFNGGTYIGSITTFDFENQVPQTDLTVIGVDSFQFSDGTFTFDDLFSVGQNIVEDQLSGEFGGTTEDDFYQATTGGIANAVFATLGGNDTIIGDNLNDFGVGIQNTSISAFGEGMLTDGDNIITGNATGAFSVGMVGVQIATGSGSDTITARGTLFGVEDVSIAGGEGGDIFDLQSGTGTVLGEKGDDRLILEGQSSDYMFQGISTSLLAGEITGIDSVGARTDLTVVGVENFQFSDGSFTFDELFMA